MKRILISIFLAALASFASAQGLVVGVFDSGFDYTHPAFLDADGRLCISRVWEQGTDGRHPEGYDYGLELTTSQDIMAAGADTDEQSHGSHVAARALQYAGTCDGTELVIVAKTAARLDEQQLRDGIRYIFDYAESVGKPCVINLSLGNNMGPHDGTSEFDRFVDSIVGPGRIIVGAAGNSGASTCHLSTDGAPLRSFLIYRTEKSTQGTVDIWGSRGMQYSVQLCATQYVNGNVSSQSEVVVVGGEAQPQTYVWAPSTGRLKGTFTFVSEISPLNDCPHARLDIDQTSAAMNYDLAVCITPLTAGTVHAWADDITSSFHNRDRADYAMGDNLYTIKELGSTADSIISVGAMDTAHQIIAMSSHGPRIDGTVKPNVYAFGDNVESALNSFDRYQETYPYTRTVTREGRDYHYGLMTGTSMAAPMVTGIVGTWLRHNPRLTPGGAMAMMDPDRLIDPERGLSDGIIHVTTDTPAAACYDLQGRSISVRSKGITLRRTADGRVRKMLVR